MLRRRLAELEGAMRTQPEFDPSSAVGARSHRLHFPALDRHIDCREDETLYAAARRSALRLVGACGGRGTCGSCKVRIVQGQVHAESDAPAGPWQRACRLRPASDLTLDVAPRSLATIVRAEIGSAGHEAQLPHDPALIAVELRVTPPTLDDPCSESARLCRALAAERPDLPTPSIDWAAAVELPALLRAHGGRLSARLALGDGAPRLIGGVRSGAPLLGLAVDLGTTNAAAFLVDLASGKRLASLGLENPQAVWGADLISRINHAIRDPAAARALRQAAVEAINALAHDLARAVGATAADIAEVVVAGNTAMQHLLAGWPVAQLGRAPFVAACNGAVELPARELGLQMALGATLHLAPGIGGFIGGDHVAALLATEPLWQQPGTTLVMDIGTNTELSLVQDGHIASASCPSGPALEGGHIGCGMRAARGAIERVSLDDKASLRCQVIGGGPPVGLCGSGVVDALAAFVGAGWIDARGRIVGDAAAIAEVDGVRTITLVDETAHAPAVCFNQHDVRAVQLAKSAIRTGVRLLTADAGLAEAQIDRFVIAGAFGATLSVDSGVAIGLFPDLPRERFNQVGNAAGLGVQQMLASRERRSRAARLATECKSVELATRTDFQKTFLHHIGFQPLISNGPTP